MCWRQFKPLLLGTLLLILTACQKSGGSEPGNLELVSTNFVSKETRAVNLALEFHFNKPVELESVSFETMAIQATAPAGPGISPPAPPQGLFYLKDEGRTVVFQPRCPDGENRLWGFSPSPPEEQFIYQIFLRGSDDSGGPALLATDGSKLGRSFSAQIGTPHPTQGTVQDPRPENPPRLAVDQELPAVLPMNLFSHPLEPIRIELDQPVRAETIHNSSIAILYPDEEALLPDAIPTDVVLAENCTATGGAVLLAIPRGILRPEAEVEFWLSREVSGLSPGDTHAADVLLHQARIQAAARPVQADAIRESFLDQEGMDPNPASLHPLARWEKGTLQSGPLFSGPDSSVRIVIGNNSTNGKKVLFDTAGGVLKDTQGSPIFFPDGVIEVGELLLQGGATLEAVGPNPLVIRAAKKITVQAGARISVNGQKPADVETVGTANLPVAGGDGRASGGDGGVGSPETTQSSPKGGDGMGPFNAPASGGGGGHSAFGDSKMENTRAAGGGGGNWGIWEFDPAGNYQQFCYGSKRYCSNCENCEPGKNGSNQVNNSAAEAGHSGSRRSGSTGRQYCRIFGHAIAQKDAITGNCLAKGGLAGPAVFADADRDNNFMGRKPVIDGDGALAVLEGELHRVQGGQGGGAGGDNVKWVSFPSPRNRFPQQGVDYKGGAGGGGAGALVLESLGPINIHGHLTANGGRGAKGEVHIFARGEIVGGPGGAGGAGGFIQIESATSMFFGRNATILARGGNRGFGCGNIPGDASANPDRCKDNGCAGVGGAGGKGVILLKGPFQGGVTGSCKGVTQPILKSGFLTLEADKDPYATFEVRTERDLSRASCGVPQQAYRKFDPAPQLLLPSFGSKYTARSQWIYLGDAEVVNHATFHFPATDATTGELDPSRVPVLASGNGGVLRQEGHSLTLDNPALADLVRSEPNILIEDDFFPQPGIGEGWPILAARVEENLITLDLDPSSGILPPVGDWMVKRNAWKLLVGGRPARDLPESGSIRILFQGATPSAPGSRIPEPGSILPPTADLSDLMQNHHPQLLRFEVLLETNAEGGALDPLALPGIGLEVVKVPYLFSLPN